MKSRFFKKLFTMGLAVSILTSSFTGIANAESKKSAVVEKSVGSGGVQASISLEKAIAITKEKLAIPEGLDKFSSDFSDYNGKSFWHLHWNASQPPLGGFNVSINAISGEITNIDYYRDHPPGARYSGMPQYTREKALKIAENWASKMLPDKFKKTVSASNKPYENVVVHNRDYPVVYNFNFTRTTEGIPVSGQGINVGINGENGELMSFHSNWDESAVLPSPSGSISADRAKKIFMEKAGYELTYFMPRQEGDPDQVNELKLAYRPKPPGRFIINALTGEFVDQQKMYLELDEMFGAGGAGGDRYMSRAKQAEALTPAETKAVQETKGLITADRANKIAESTVTVPKGMALTGKSLQRSYEVPGGRVWSLTYTEKEKKSQLGVSVDARTGELLGFYKNNNDENYNKEPVVKVSEEQAKKIARDMIAKFNPGKMEQVILRQVEPEPGPWIKFGKEPVPGAYFFNYARVINGIVYPENGFRVRVNSTTGEVTNYEFIWWETKFPSPQGVIGINNVNERLLAERPLKITYARGHQQWIREEDNAKYYLVYSLRGGYKGIIDAFSGQEIDYQGNPVTKNVESFTDIAGHPAEQDIMLLTEQRVVGGEDVKDGKFRPNDIITVAELSAMLVKSSKGYYYSGYDTADIWYKKYIDAALEMGILEKDIPFTPEAKVTRLQYARMLINAQGFGKLARVPDIFKLNVKDAGAVPKAYHGYVSAVVGQGLIPAEGGNFYPSRQVTRGDAASILVRMLKS